MILSIYLTGVVTFFMLSTILSKYYIKNEEARRKQKLDEEDKILLTGVIILLSITWPIPLVVSLFLLIDRTIEYLFSLFQKDYDNNNNSV